MSDNVVKLKPDETLDGEPDTDIIDKLERLLERAKSGDIRAFAYAVVQRQNVLATGWEGTAGTRCTLASSVGILNARYLEGLMEGSKKSDL